MTTKPAIVLVPGAFHHPPSYRLFEDEIKAAGYDYDATYKPSTSKGPPYSQGLEPDVEAVRKTITKFTDHGRDVLLVMHSYGGAPGAAAAEGLSKSDRAAKGEKGGIVGLIYVAAVVLPKGLSCGELAAKDGNAPPEFIDFRDGYAVPHNPGQYFYNDLPEQEAAKWIELLENQSLGPYPTPQTYAAHEHIPSTYVVTEKDMIMLPAIQRELAAQQGQWQQMQFLQTGHSPFVSAPKDVARIVRQIAGE